MPNNSETEFKMLQLQVSQHQEEIAAIKQSTREQITAQSKLIESIQELTGVLREHTVRHEHVSKTQEMQDVKLQELDKTVRKIENQNSANQPVLDGVKKLNDKLIWLFISMIVTAFIAGTGTIGPLINK